MKKALVMYPIVAVMLLAAGAAFIPRTTTLKVNNQEKAAKRTSAGKRDMCCVESDDAQTMNANSLFQLDATWKNQAGKTARLDDFRGKEVVISMFYSNCTYACPLTINDLKIIQSRIPAQLKGRVEFVLVSIDPIRDTPQALRALAAREELSSEQWCLLTGRSYDVRTLAAALGVEYKKQVDGTIVHSSQIAVLNCQGEIICRHSGLSRPVDDVVESVIKDADDQ